MSERGEPLDSLDPQRPKRPTGASPALPKWIPAESAGADVFADWINELYELNGRDPFVGGERFGTHGDAPIKLYRESGQAIRWPHQSQLDRAASLQAPLRSEAGIRPRKLNTFDVALIGWAITKLATLRLRLDPQEELVLWWSRYVDSRPTRHVDIRDDAEWRQVLAEWQAAREADELRRNDIAWQTFVVVVTEDEHEGERYVRREDFAAHCRSIVRGALSWPTLNGRIAEAGWQQTRFQRKATEGGAPYVEARCYVVPADWPQGDAPVTDDAVEAAADAS